MLAVISDEPLGFDWMPDDTRVPARVLRPSDVDCLLDRLRSIAADRWIALSTYFDVIA